MDVFEKTLKEMSRPKSGIAPFLRQQPWLEKPALFSSRSAITSHLWELELRSTGVEASRETEIQELAKRSLDQNLFFNPAVLTACWPRMSPQLAKSGALYLFLYETTGQGRALKAFAPVEVCHSGTPKRASLRVLAHHFAPLGVPLIDAENADEACEKLLQLLADPGLKLPTIFDLPFIELASETGQALSRATTQLGLDWQPTRRHKRAMFTKQGVDLLGPGKKRSEKLARRRRLLNDGGWTFELAEQPALVTQALEEFLALEASGWKGRSGSAVLGNARTAAYARQMVSQLASQGACQIASYRANGRVIASIVLFHSAGHFVTWKMAYAEDVARASPGVQLLLEVSRHLAGQKSFVKIDSLAPAGNAMVESLWPERMDVADLVINLRSNGPDALGKFVSARSRHDKLRAMARHLVNKVVLSLRRR